LSSVIPQVVDSNFYSFDGTTTKFIGSVSPQFIEKNGTLTLAKNPAFLSIPTVTGTSSGTTITTTQTARMGLFTGTPPGTTDTEYSVVLAPDLVNEVQGIMSTFSKRDLEERGATLVSELIELLGPEMTVSLSTVVNLAKLPGIEAMAGTIIALGPLAIAGAAFLTAVVNQFSLIVSLHNSGAFPTAVKVPLSQFRDTKSCPNPQPKCSDSSCNGVALVCTASASSGCKSIQGQSFRGIKLLISISF
jgi:hypothetical protein